MARHFTAASSQYFKYGTSSPVTNYPFTISVWYKPTSLVQCCTVGLSGVNAGSGDGYCLLSLMADGTVRLQTDDSDNSANLLPNSGATVLSTGTWARITGVWAAANDRRLYVDTTKFTDSSSETVPINLSIIEVGAQRYGGSDAVQPCDGDIADVAVWSSALTDADVAALAAGYAARCVMPSTLKFYAPLLGNVTNEIDQFGNRSLVPSASAPTTVTHPRIIQKPARRMGTRDPVKFSGTITESLAVTDWRVTATRCADGSLAGTTRTNGATYSFISSYEAPCTLTFSPHIDYRWSAAKVVALDDLCVPSNPDSTPRLYKATSIGSAPHQTHSTTEPTWPTSGTVVDNDITWTFVIDLDDGLFKTLGAKIPT